MTERIFITGSNRGIGLAVVKEYLSKGDVHVFAACRIPSSANELQNLTQKYPDKLTIVALEVTDQNSIDAAFKAVAEKTSALDVVINNAAINPEGQSFAQITAELMLRVFEVNSVAPMMVSQAAFPLLKEGNNPRLIHISSDMASLAGRTYGGDYGYCSSKAALNMMMRGMAVDVMKYGGITTIALDPGWVQTDMGSPNAPLTPQDSASGVVTVISGLTSADNGRYLAYDGSEHEW